ncbi:caspase family protein [Crocinitomicaceae bacterium]|nr:caspase family protein [Crocinitomicaceae bacterium]
MKNLFFFFFFFMGTALFAQQKHALVVAVADYPEVEGRMKNWDDLSSDQDVELLRKMLEDQGFPEENTTYLMDSEATVENLDNAFESLKKRVNQGDIIYFHYSGHGQQILDVNGKKYKRINVLAKDEADGFDETLVLYNAPMRYYKGYEFEHHYADDQLNVHITDLRKSIGSDGQIVVVIDACHSGSATRGEDEPTVRGTDEPCAPKNYSGEEETDDSEGFGTDFSFGEDPSLGKLVAFFGCKAEQVNREYRPDLKSNKRYGSLTYFLIKGMENLTSNNATYANLFSEIRKNMVLSFKNAQQPEIEGDDLNQLIFSGEFKEQEQFYLLEPVIYATKATLQAGQLQGIMPGDSIALFENTVNRMEEGTLIVRGLIESSTPLKSTVKLDKSLPNGKDNGALYRVFKTHDTSLDIDVRVKLDVSGSVKNKLKKALQDIPNVHIENKDYEYLIKEVKKGNGENGLIIYLGSDSDLPLRYMRPIPLDAVWLVDSMVTYIKQAARVNALRRVSSNFDDIDFEIIVTNNAKEPISPSNLLTLEKDKIVRIYIENTGNTFLNVSMINISANNKIRVSSERNKAGIDIGKKRQIAYMKLSDLGIDHYKFIASSSFIDLSPFGKLGSDLSGGTRGGDKNFFTDFINENVSGTRGSTMEETEITIKSIEFDVKENKD